MKKLVKTPKINKLLIRRLDVTKSQIEIEIDEKTRQNAENKQTFDLSGNLKLVKKLVKTLKINKLVI